jgi:hypothetical protein
VEEREPGEQIIHKGLGAVGVIGVAASASAEASEVDGIAQVDALVRVVAVEESQERFAGLGVDVGTVGASCRRIPFPLSCDVRHAWANGVSKRYDS